MLKIFFLVLLMIPSSVHGEPSTTLDELMEILTLLQEAQNDYKMGLTKISNGQTELMQGLTESRAETAKLRTESMILKGEVQNLKQQQKNSVISFNDYKTNIETTVIPIIEDQTRQLTGLKILAIGTSIVAVGGIVTAILVAILK